LPSGVGRDLRAGAKQANSNDGQKTKRQNTFVKCQHLFISFPFICRLFYPCALSEAHEAGINRSRARTTAHSILWIPG
jgi:hypothetical protein